MIVRDIWMGMTLKISIIAHQITMAIFILVCAKALSTHDRAWVLTITLSGVMLVALVPRLLAKAMVPVHPKS